MEPKEVRTAVEALYSGRLAKDIKSNASYALTGMAIGAVVGMIVASFAGKSRLLFGMGGAVVFGGAGYLISSKKED